MLVAMGFAGLIGIVPLERAVVATDQPPPWWEPVGLAASALVLITGLALLIVPPVLNRKRPGVVGFRGTMKPGEFRRTVYEGGRVEHVLEGHGRLEAQGTVEAHGEVIRPSDVEWGPENPHPDSPMGQMAKLADEVDRALSGPPEAPPPEGVPGAGEPE